MSVLEEKPVSVHHTIAQYYWLDARDFMTRFDALWEVETHKTGRIKTFVDLLMGCECVLKAHIMLGLANECPKEAYSTLRGASHRVSDLTDAANLNKDRSDYEFLKQELSEFPVKIRYSLDAYDTFFPMLGNWSEAEINHTKTIGSQPWVMSIRNALGRLIDDLQPYLTGLVSNDLEKLWRNEVEVKAVITGYRR